MTWMVRQRVAWVVCKLGIKLTFHVASAKTAADTTDHNGHVYPVVLKAAFRPWDLPPSCELACWLSSTSP